MQHLMKTIDTLRLNRNAYETLQQTKDTNVRYMIGSGEYWDCILHILPEKTSFVGRQPTGSWTALKTLIGLTEISAVSGPDANNLYKSRGTKRKLVGGSDGSLAGSQTSASEPCIKYVGGPLRQYTSPFGNTALLEVTVRPPVKSELDYSDVITELPLDLRHVFTVVLPEPETLLVEKEKPSSPLPSSPAEAMKRANLNDKIGMTFDNVGGLNAQLQDIARRVLASRANPEMARKLGIQHVKGILLSGPPGCGYVPNTSMIWETKAFLHLPFLIVVVVASL
jgi:hypothetical protein